MLQTKKHNGIAYMCMIKMLNTRKFYTGKNLKSKEKNPNVQIKYIIYYVAM